MLYNDQEIEPQTLVVSGQECDHLDGKILFRSLLKCLFHYQNSFIEFSRVFTKECKFSFLSLEMHGSLKLYGSFQVVTKQAGLPF